MQDESYMAESGGLMDDVLDKVYSEEASSYWFNRQKKKGIELRDKKQGKFAKNDFAVRDSLLDIWSDSPVSIS
jgi:hypothetical protein